ncbi:hypothetical protein [Gordonia sihwensis]|uniref:hypothetical protein n=1 Tax=Gordonia sihwensis TaxID=173559 RepID=UPI0005EFDBE4|nr:hypothetical protein [Gordonia sihwensis]KJR10457.1 hypothetical protein UG54_00190 [Gordonia sihwensis]
MSSTPTASTDPSTTNQQENISMEVERIDDTGTYRCERGEFTALSATLPAGPPPPIFGLSHWIRDDPRLRRRRAGDQDLVDLTHEGQAWTYALSLAYTVDTEGAGFWQIAEGFDVATRVD